MIQWCGKGFGQAGSSTKLGAVPVLVVGFATASLSRTWAFCRAWMAVAEFCALRGGRAKKVITKPPTSAATPIKLTLTFISAIEILLYPRLVLVTCFA